MPNDLSHTEDSLPSLRRRRLLAQLDLAFTPLTPTQNAAVDAICDLLPLADIPQPLQEIATPARPIALGLMRQLPVTHVITRCSEGRWPE